MARHSAAAANLEAIRKGLADVWTSQGRQFVTFEAQGESGSGGGDAWIQYLDGELNVRWPLADEPAVALVRHGVALPRGAFAGWHVPGQNAVFEVGDVPLDDVARLIQSLFAQVLAASQDHRVAARVESHS